MLKQMFIASLILIILNVSAAIADISGTSLTGVGYENGSFERQSNGNWLEKQANGQSAFEFLEVSRTPQSVNLLDKTRNVSLILDLDLMQVWHSNDSISFRPLYNIFSISDNSQIEIIRRQNNDRVETVSTGIQPDLLKNWNSDFGIIYWPQRRYKDTNQIIEGGLVKEDGLWMFRGVWGRFGSSERKPLKFIFNPQTGESFSGQYISSDGSTKTWNGSIPN